MPPPLTLVAGLSTTLRDDLVRCLVLRRPGLVAVTYGIEPGGLQRRTFDCSGEQDRRRLEACCLSCAVRADAARALEQVHGADRWQEVVLALPAPVSPRDVAGDLEVDTVTTLVDARLLLPHLSGDDLLVERGLAAAGADRRSTGQLPHARSAPRPPGAAGDAGAPRSGRHRLRRGREHRPARR